MISAVEKEVRTRLKSRQAAQSAAQRQQIRDEIEAEQTSARLAKDRAARSEAGTKAAEATRALAPVVTFTVGGKAIAAVCLGAPDQVIALTSEETCREIVHALSRWQRSRIVAAHATGTVPAIDMARVLALVNEASQYSQRQGTAAIQIEH